MTPKYLTALRQSIRTCEKSEISEESLRTSGPLISHNSLISHLQHEQATPGGNQIGQFQEPKSNPKGPRSSDSPTREISEKSEISPRVTSLNSLNSLFSQ